MPGGGRCPDCGSTELVEDSHYSQNQLVCSDCGCVVTEGVLTTTFTDEGNLRGTSAGFSGAVGTAWGCGGIDVRFFLSPALSLSRAPLNMRENSLKWTSELQKVRDCHSSVFF